MHIYSNRQFFPPIFICLDVVEWFSFPCIFVVSKNYVEFNGILRKSKCNCSECEHSKKNTVLDVNTKKSLVLCRKYCNEKKNDCQQQQRLGEVAEVMRRGSFFFHEIFSRHRCIQKQQQQQQHQKLHASFCIISNWIVWVFIRWTTQSAAEIVINILCQIHYFSLYHKICAKKYIKWKISHGI